MLTFSRHVRTTLVALLLAVPSLASAAPEPPLRPPPVAGPRTDGIVLGVELGGGGCPDCPVTEPGGSFSLRLAYRLKMGLALGTSVLIVGTEGPCLPMEDGSACEPDQYQLGFLSADVRWYPLPWEWFDPYVGVGFARAWAGYDGKRPETRGYAIVPRFGAVGIVTNYLSFGLTVARSFSSWDEIDVGDAWLFGLEFTVRMWGP